MHMYTKTHQRTAAADSKLSNIDFLRTIQQLFTIFPMPAAAAERMPNRRRQEFLCQATGVALPVYYKWLQYVAIQYRMHRSLQVKRTV